MKKMDILMATIGITCAVLIAGLAAPMAAHGYQSMQMPAMAIAVDILITTTGVTGLMIFSRALLRTI